MGKVVIRRMRLSDVSSVIHILKRVEEFKVDARSGWFWSKKQLDNWVKSKKDSLFVAEKDNQILGFVTFAHHVPTGKVTFENAWVDKNFRGKGLIDKLTSAGIQDLKKKRAVYLLGLPRTNNLASINFLKRNKFMKGFDFSWLHRKL